MDLHEYLTALRTRWITIVLLGIIGAVLGYAYATTIPSQYRATSSVFLSAGEGSTTSELVQGSTFTQSLVQSYAQLATQPIVLIPVIQDLGLDETPAGLASSITADAPLNTVIIEISATETSAKKAAEIANAVTGSLANAAKTISPTAANGKPSITMTLVAHAQVPTHPVAPNVRLLIITGAVLGLVAGIVYALGRALLDTRIRGERDVKRSGAGPLIGLVPRRRRSEPHGLAMLAVPHGAAADGYRRIRSNLEFADVDHRISSLIVTSAMPGEGKTTTTINLALAIAEREKRVLIIDADLHRPAVAEYCGVEGAVGLTTVLVGDVDVHTAIRQWSPGVDVLPSGVCPANPNQVLASNAMAKLLTELKQEYDFIIVDTPPLLPSSDALTLAHLTEAVMLVTMYNYAHRGQLFRAYSALLDVKAPVIGVVLNNTPRSRSESYYIAEEPKPRRPLWRPTRKTPTAEPASDERRPVLDVDRGLVVTGPIEVVGDGSEPEDSTQRRLRAVARGDWDAEAEQDSAGEPDEPDETDEPDDHDGSKDSGQRAGGYARASGNG